MQTWVQVVHKHGPILELDANNLHWLTDDELTRYQAISSSQRRQQFLAGHYLIRKMASRLYANTVEDWIYCVDDNNLRGVKCRQAGIPELHVSLSHSGDWIAAAISTSAIGIDIETYSKQRDFIAIASHVFSESETNLLKSLTPDQLNQQFYLYWTLKESVAKQYGVGLKFEISRLQSPVLVSDGELANMRSWQCPDYVIALASDDSMEVETLGLCDKAKHQVWKNIYPESIV